VRFVINYTDTEHRITLGDEWFDAFTGEKCRNLPIGPVDLRIIRTGT
jgi:hypothetical protein